MRSQKESSIFSEHMLEVEYSATSSASVTQVIALVPSLSVDVLATPKEETKSGACGVIQVPNITRRSEDALHTLRPPQFLTSRQSLFYHGRDCDRGEGWRFDWLFQFQNRIRAGAAPLGVARTP